MLVENADPTRASESFVIGSGETLAAAITAAQRDLEDALEQVAQLDPGYAPGGAPR